MTERTESSRDRIEIALDRGTRIFRLLTWVAMFVLVCLMLWVVSGMAAKAEEDPKAAARAIGNAGNAAARTIARDSSNAAEIPGYAGTNLPERSIGASRLQDEGRARLADPDDPGGAAGRAVIRGTTSRPSESVSAGDPVVRRSETISASPHSSAHGADGLASGSTTECGADLQDAEDGGSCGSVRYCVGAGCETVSSQSNTGFVNATTRLNMAVELGGDEFDRADMRFFTGQRRRCHIKLFGLANCCKNSGLLIGLGNCSASEKELAKERNAGNTHYLGRYCSKRTFFGVCIRRSRAWCVFGSKLGRILQQQGRSQLGIGWGSCRGLTIAEVESIDFARVDLSEFTQDLMDGSREPSVSLPDSGDTGTAMRTRIRDFYRRGQ
ncbi:MAG: conjugal transfer protein TraN [Rhodospirillaceae bacterium]|nr:conjugal transfer protein TraN [Rhodospirillaceae bacterium]